MLKNNNGDRIDNETEEPLRGFLSSDNWVIM